MAEDLFGMEDGMVEQGQDPYYVGGLGGLFIGHFVQYGGGLYFLDSHLTRYELDQVRYGRPFWGPSRGLEDYPVPWEYDDDGNVTKAGDRVLYGYEEGKLGYVIILCSVQMAKTPFPVDPESGLRGDPAPGAAADQERNQHWENQAAKFKSRIDQQGNLSTVIESKGGDHGNVRLEIRGEGTTNFTIKISGPLVVEQAKLTEQHYDETVLITSGGEVHIKTAADIKWGDNPPYTAVRFDTLKPQYDSHTHPVAGAMTGPPVIPLDGAGMIAKCDQVKMP